MNSNLPAAREARPHVEHAGDARRVDPALYRRVYAPWPNWLELPRLDSVEAPLRHREPRSCLRCECVVELGFDSELCANCQTGRNGRYLIFRGPSKLYPQSFYVWWLKLPDGQVFDRPAWKWFAAYLMAIGLISLNVGRPGYAAGTSRRPVPQDYASPGPGSMSVEQGDRFTALWRQKAARL